MYNDSEIARWKAAYDERSRYKRVVVWATVAGCAILIVFVGLILAWKAITPKLNLYKSNTEKQAVIKEQEAISEAEVFAAEKRVIAARAEADARRIEASGIADAQALIAATLTPEYLRWRYYEVLATTANQVIYVPTEAGLPVLEAQRLANGEQP
jgi:hypothetical protein